MFNPFFPSNRMMKIQRRIAIGMDVLTFFTMHKWYFKQDNFQALTDKMENFDEQKM